ncbi:hypothetical protein [Bradyrhizobium australiense]|uniref:Uncharacterized protein n=1 Tax=Bradyrhizobium australiense TaxID=2721161 RepID=A0A7Y4GRZ6_9BRAD|nr:hypothetical protein [Bradyrhizobium australiense]NOJ40899.1 hypothetical protein [Bradyrhizobium australiense]
MDEQKIRQALAMFPGARRAADGVILDGEDGSFYITDFGPKDEDLSFEEGLFVPFCSKTEILRLRALKSANDCLLRVRANAIADSARMTRVMSARRKLFEAGGREWTLTSYYHRFNAPAKRYIRLLPRRDRHIAMSVPFGFAPVDEANAICVRTLLGDVIILSEALREFYYFMTICIHGEKHGIELSDQILAGCIAVRIMNGSEALDFDIDPRGFLPPRTEARIRQFVDAMIEFTFGHELAHLLLGHLASNSPSASVQDAEFRTYAHEEEYAADLHAIKNVTSKKQREALAVAAFNVFAYLHFFELVGAARSEVKMFSVSSTHPSPIKRLENLKSQMPTRLDTPDQVTDVLTQYRDVLLQFLSRSGRQDLLTFYGSLYLPGLRGEVRQDRIDF